MTSLVGLWSKEDGAVNVHRHWGLKERHHLTTLSPVFFFSTPLSTSSQPQTPSQHFPYNRAVSASHQESVLEEGEPGAHNTRVSSQRAGGQRTDLFHTFQYVVHWSPLHCIIMHKWMLTWNLQNLFSGLYLHAIFLFGSVCVVYSDCSPEQLAAIMNCSRHERHTRNYDYMEGGDVRIRQLFSRTQWFLTIDDNGNINGTQDPTNCHSKHNPFFLITMSLNVFLHLFTNSTTYLIYFSIILPCRVQLWALSRESAQVIEARGRCYCTQFYTV